MLDPTTAGLSPWEAELLALANADDADPAAEACRPPEVVDGGEWAGTTLEAWHARFAGRTDEHAGSVPIFVGPARRRADRVLRRRKVEAA